MSALSIQVPFPVFQGRDGQPLENGYVWIGEPNLNPQTNPVVAYYDAALTIPAPQPLRTLNGYISRAGTPAQIYVDGVNFSILVQDSKGSMVYNFPDGTGISPDASGVTYDPPFTGGVPTTVQDKLAQVVSVKDFGAVGDYTTDDSNAVAAALAAVTEGGEVFFPRGVYRVTRSFDLPLGVKLRGVGRPTMQIAPIYEDDKRYLRPGYKHLIPGSTIIFDGAQTLTKTTSRTDRFSSFGYALSTTFDYPNEISDLGLIMDMDVFTAGGALTTPATDNRSNYDSCLLINDSPLCNITNVCMFGYWSKSCVTVVSQDSMANPDYNFFTNCEMAGDIGVALIGSMVVNASAEGLSGSIFTNCKINDRTHHDRTQTNVLELGTNVIYVDGITSVSTMIAGHKFIGCSLRGTVEVPINLDQADSFSLIGCVTEFTNNALYAPATSQFIVGTANTRGVSLAGNRALGNGANIQRLAGQIRGPLIVDEDDDGVSFIAKFGKGVCIGPADELSNDPTVQLTDDFTGGTKGWNIRYGISSGLLNINFDNVNVAKFDSAGNVTPANRLTKILGATTRQSHTIAAGAITINGTSSYLSIATEGGAATDDLDTISGGETGDILIVTAFSGSNTVVLKDGPGNLRLAGDCSLDNSDDTIMLMLNVSGNWVEVSRSDNGA